MNDLEMAAVINNIPNFTRHLENGTAAVVTDLAIRLAFEPTCKPKILSLLLQNTATCTRTLHYLRDNALRPTRSISSALSGEDREQARMNPQANANANNIMAICHVFVQNAKKKLYIYTFLQELLRDLIIQTPQLRRICDYEAVAILLAARVVHPGHEYLFRLAIRGRNGFVCKLLVLVYHVNPFIVLNDNNNDRTYGLTPLNAATAGDDDGDPDLVVMLVLFNLWKNTFITKHGDFPLHIIVRDEQVSDNAIDEAVMMRPHDLEAVNEDGDTPLHVAAMSGMRNAVIAILIREYPAALAVVNNEGNTPLHVAAMSGANIAVINTLLRAHAPALEVVNNMGLAPVHVAATSDAGIDIVYTLLCQNPLALWRLRLPTANTAIIQPGAAAAAAIDVGISRQEFEALRAEKDAELERLRAEIESLRAQLKAGNDAEIEDAKKAASSSSSTNANDDVDGSSGIHSSSVIVVVAAVGDHPPSASAAGTDGQQHEHEALLNADNAAPPPPSKKAKTAH